MKKIIFMALFLVLIFVNYAFGAQPKSKFYDFGDQLIDGKINKPTTLYTDARQQVKFDRLIKLKKSFLNSLYTTAKEKVFK
jgi:hypothetical protein